MNLFKVFKIINKRAPVYLPVIAPLSVAGGLFDGISVMMVLPILELFDSGKISEKFGFLSKGLTFVGLEISAVNLLILLAVAVIMKAILGFIQRLFSIYIALNYEAQAKSGLWEKVLWGRWESSQNLSTGKISNTMLVEIPRTRDTFMYVGDMAASLVFVIAYSVIGAMISYEGLLIAIGATLCLAVIYIYIVRRSRKLGERLTELNYKAQHSLHEGIIGLKYIKSTFLNEKIYCIYAKDVNDIRSNSIVFSAYNALVSVISEPFSLIVIGTVAVYHFSSNQPFTEFIAISLVLFRLYQKTSSILNTLPAINNLMPSWVAVERIRVETTEFTENFGTEPFTSLSRNVNFVDVDFEYQDGSRVLSKCNMVVEKGKTTALIGVSGAGKTTIVDLVVGLLEPSAGAVLVDGMSMKNIDLRQFRQRLGIVPQEPVLFNDTIENNIRLQRPTANEAEMEQAAHVAYAHEFIIALPDGYKTVIGERGTKLSGGQRQRIALARSLLANPEILILDEATSALDNESENKIRRALVKLHGKLTILIVAHREKTIEDADVVYEISDGKAEKVSSSYFAHYNRIKD